MELHFKKLKSGSIQGRGVAKAGGFATSDLDLVFTLEPQGDGVCEIIGAKGDLDNDTNIKIGLKAMELGFSKLRFEVLKGRKVTRWARFLRTEDGHDFYEADLEAAKKILNGAKDA